MVLNFVRNLGGGGFGVVDLVVDEFGQNFARKTFSVSQPMPQALVENVKKRFAKEARVQSGIRHENIVRVLYSDLASDPPYYLMPVAQGSLQDDLDKDRTIGGYWLTSLSDIVTALEEMHAAGIYHRDLKPQNVLKYVRQTLNGPEYFYAVSDFGLIAMNESRLSVLTSTGMAKSTDYYTAPEITSDLRQATAQSDIYSLGCILHEIVGTKPRVPCAEIREDGPYSAILRNCTRADPSRRFSSVRAVLDAISTVASGLPPLTTSEAAGFADELATGDLLSEASWRALVTYVEDNERDANSEAVLARLQYDQVADLCVRLPSLADRLALVYAQWVDRSSFPFERCDGLGSVLEIFVSSCSPEAKADSIVALLKLGTSHNRWYVERKLFNLCSFGMDEMLARRVAIEFRAMGADVCRMISHLETSIGVNRSGLHPTLYQTLVEICA